MGFWDSVSDGLERFGRGVESFGEDAVRATKEFSQIQKLRGEAEAARRTVNMQYLRLGRKFYEEHREDPDYAEDPMIVSIRENLVKEAECEKEIAVLKESGSTARAEAAEADDACTAARDIEAEERAAQKASRADDREVERANAEDDIVDYTPVEPADDSDFEEE